MHCEVSVKIPAPIDVAWRIAQDPQLRPGWDVRIAKYDVQGAQAVGTEVLITFRAGVIRPVSRGTILRWAPPHQSGLQVERGSSSLVLPGAGSWTFEDKGDHTILTSRFTLRQETLPKWMPAWLYIKAAEWDTKRSFRRLRRLVVRKLKEHTSHG